MTLNEHDQARVGALRRWDKQPEEGTCIACGKTTTVYRRQITGEDAVGLTTGLVCQACFEGDNAACLGCGRVDPCGIHYPDCTLLEHGDLLIPRGLDAEQERLVDASQLVEYDGCPCAMWERHDTGDRVVSGQHGDECDLPDKVAQVFSAAVQDGRERLERTTP